MTCLSLAGAALIKCLAANPACLPPDHRPYLRDVLALAEQESSYRPWTLRDETEGKAVYALGREGMAAEIVARLQKGHVLGVGLFQITGRANWRRHGLLTVEDLTDPCKVMAAGAAHWAADLKAAADQKYNSGRFDGAPVYARQMAERRLRLAALADAPPAPSPPASAPEKAPPAPRERASAFERLGRPSAFSRLPDEAGRRGIHQRLTDLSR